MSVYLLMYKCVDYRGYNLSHTYLGRNIFKRTSILNVSWTIQNSHNPNKYSITLFVSPTMLLVDGGCTDHMFNSCSQLTKITKSIVTVTNSLKVAFVCRDQRGILRRIYYSSPIPQSTFCKAFTNDVIVVSLDNDYAIIHLGSSVYQFDPLKTYKVDGHYKVSQVFFELFTIISHVWSF